MAVQGGFVVGTLASALLNLPDLVNPRRLFALGCVVGAVMNAALVGASHPAVLVALRVVTGVALAWVYPPGMKVAAGWFQDRRGAALGVLIGALTVGSAFPHLLAVASATIPWRTLMWAASALALAGGVIVARRRRRRPLRRDDRAVRPGRDRPRVLEPRHAPRDARLPGPHVGAVRRMDVDGRVRGGEPRGRARERRRRRPAGSIGDRVHDDRERRDRIGRRGRVRGSDRQGAHREMGDARQRRRARRSRASPIARPPRS